MNSDERIAVLEAKLERNELDITKLFDFIRQHMEQEEKDRVIFLSKLGRIDNTIKNQKSFVGGIVFAVSGAWVVGCAVAYWVFKIKGH